MRRSIPILVALLALTGCAAQQARTMSPEALEPLYCEGAEQCALYWKRSQLWIARNSRWKIQSATDVVITTYTPTGSSAEFGFQVTREPTESNARERIVITPMCANIFGCGDLNGTIVSFKRYVRVGQN